MEKQRYKQERLDHQSFDSFPVLLTPLAIEVHAARLYTRSLFIRIQKEIIAGSWLCSIKSKISEEGSDISIISEELIIPDSMPDATEINKAEDSDDEVEEIDLYKKSTREYKVLHNRSDDSVVCCCQLFVRCGILCRHVFCVFKNFNVQKILHQYLLKRWTRDLIPPGLRRKKNRYGEKNENISNLFVQATSLVDDCCQILRNDEPKLS
ncbi:FAR1 DNA binding domain, Zinc finger, SWIM-type, MULE transposase domain, FHY3/FAR1 family [Artemisia annua]|uniref:FAR1 DNA binding domain, Zinc finger, SWIM-type, MULE transposase domain, FHY3/FAR1 family n=1 Tax=Artemisia annua TaxID=35608 RepID=A0A2U1QBX8_ARTAN|nr:FAR1 DNA binding domain, Zinc finger, SWIM-type, MULE transposase domain, FHY3/FAR1 family [Artemisia annua]